MGDLSKNFSRSEFKCKCSRCEDAVVDVELLNVLQELRDEFEAPIKITSGNRCPLYNKSIGGAENSKHISGIAVDVQIKGYLAEEVYKYLDERYASKYGIGRYANWVHIDIRPNKARW